MQPRDLSDHAVYVPGEGTEEVARDLGLDPEELIALSSNENPFGPSPKAVEAIQAAAPEASGYPKAAHTDLTAKIADSWDLDDEQIWLTPGADGGIDCLSRAMLDPGDAVLCPEPGFSYYPMSTQYHHGVPRSYPVRKDDEFDLDAESVLDAYDDDRIIYLTSPHNPTGRTVPLSIVEEIAERTREETLVVVDEAYGEYASVDSARTLLDDRDDIAVLRTFSKAYGLAGLRLGYVMVPNSWADAYGRVNTPFAVNELACRAGLAALDDDQHVTQTVDRAEWARKYIREHADAPSWASEGNFVLLDVGDASAVASAMKREGVIVRDCSSFGLPGCVRISCGQEDDTKRAVDVLNDVLASAEHATAADRGD